jgi:hypothetical protein
MMRRYGNMFNGNRNGIGAWGNLKCKILDSTLSGSPFKVTPFWDGRLGAMGNYGLAGRRTTQTRPHRILMVKVAS